MELDVGTGQCTTGNARMDEKLPEEPVRMTETKSGELFEEVVDRMNLEVKERRRIFTAVVKLKRLEETELGQLYSNKQEEESMIESLENQNMETGDDNFMITKRMHF